MTDLGSDSRGRHEHAPWQEGQLQRTMKRWPPAGSEPRQTCRRTNIDSRRYEHPPWQASQRQPRQEQWPPAGQRAQRAARGTGRRTTSETSPGKRDEGQSDQRDEKQETERRLGSDSDGGGTRRVTDRQASAQRRERSDQDAGGGQRNRTASDPENETASVATERSEGAHSMSLSAGSAIACEGEPPVWSACGYRRTTRAPPASWRASDIAVGVH